MNTRKMLVLFTVVLIAISTGLSGCGCGGDNSQPGEDAALDAGVDGGKGDSGVPDSGTDGGGVPDGGSYDAGPDGSVADVGVADGGELDAGVDAGTDAGADSGIDAGVDGSYPPDGSFDASADGGADAGSDAGIDGGKDLMGSSISAGNAHGCGVTIAGRVRCWGLNDKGQLGNGTNTDSNVPVDVSSLSSGVASVASGQTHSCAVTTTGGVKCWGYNSYGQLGNGTNTDSNVPVDVSSLSSGIKNVTAGNSHTCAVTGTGGVKCWGYNNYGQLGDGSGSNSYVPVDVSGLSSGIQTSAAGYGHTCALTVTGGVKCWGWNNYGQLGNGANTDSNVPVDVSSLSSGVASVASGQTHSCAVTTTGGVKCWGYNSYGQLGNGTNTNSNVPVDVSGLSSGVASVTGGNNFTCAVTTTGGVKCWGTSKYGQLGNGGVSASNVPVDVSDLSSGIKFASCGFNHTCAVTTTGGIKCWGYNLFGQLGNGTFAGGSTPVDVSGLSSGVANVAGGNGYTCAATEIGGVKCWGTNNYGQIGNGTTGDSYIPTDVQGLSSDVKAVAGGGSHSCAVTKTGGVKCWGNNLFGQLGDGTNTNSDIPVDVFGLSSGIQTVTGGQYHTCALTTTGGVKCWGDNKYGKLGDGTISISNVPVDVSGLSSGVAGITGGTNHTCAVTTTGGVKCWGWDLYGQLGNGANTDSNVPVDVSGLSSGVQIAAAGSSHVCAVTATGGVKCWGLNNSGQLGNSSNTNSNVPVDVSDLSSGVQLLAGGLSHACALAVAGGVKCWGLNNYGQLGNGSNTNSNVPVDVSSLSSGKKIATGGGYHTCVVTTTGGVECWGNDSIGQLGDGKTNTRSNVPVDVSGLSSGASIVAGGDYHTCAITTAGGVKCWGENVSGQLGTGTAWYLTPQDVVGL